jgi:quinol monooxygenase YgiN
MIAGVWRAKIKKDLVDEVESLMKGKLFPVFKSNGCVGAYIAMGGTRESPEMLIVSLWKNKEPVDALTKGKGVVLPESSKYLEGEPFAEHFDVVGAL